MRRSTQPRASHTPLPRHTISSSVSSLPHSHKARRPSISNTMHWLARTSTQSSSNATSYSTSKPVRISEPKPMRSIDILSPPRTGTLGSGAMIVRTPDEALRETSVRLTYEPPDNKEEYLVKPVDDGVTSSSEQQSHTSPDEPLSPPTSPPLPPLPLPDTAEEKMLAPESVKMPPPRPIRAPPLTPPSRRSSLKARLVQVSQDTPAVPEVPLHFAASTRPPPFSAILISDPPFVKVDSSMTIVTLETCTTTYRTALNTINSRPSHLSDFISSLCNQCEPKSAASSVYSMSSEDMTAYHHHLTSQGLFPRSTTMHIFLDRPSAP